MSKRVRFTQRVLEGLPNAPEGKRTTYLDTEVPSLAVRVTAAGAKAFIVQRRVNGQPETVTLGRFPEMTVEQARKAAMGVHAKINEGTSVNQLKRAERARAVTLADAFKAYMTARTHTPNTVDNYERVMRLHLADWQQKPITGITWDMVRHRHRKLSEHSETVANATMRILRAVLTFAQGEYRDEQGRPILLENPVRALSHARAWNRETRRQGCIQAHELPGWWKATEQLTDTARDYLRLVLLTGLRRREAAGLRWEWVDLPGSKLTIPDTKNHEPHALPLSDYLFDMLTRRKKEVGGEWVFPGPGKSGHLEEPKKATQKAADLGSVHVTIHDLRRTFITIAEGLDIPPYTLKRLLNHSAGDDVTDGYIITEVERLRRPMQTITDFILKAAGERETAEVVVLPTGARIA